MERVSNLTSVEVCDNENTSPIMDTTFVLFFLAMDMGQNLVNISSYMVFTTIALLAIAILPYFLVIAEKDKLGTFLLKRWAIVGLAILFGAIFKQSLGVVFPKNFGFLPFTFLLVTALLSCFIQFYSFFRLRLSK